MPPEHPDLVILDIMLRIPRLGNLQRDSLIQIWANIRSFLTARASERPHRCLELGAN